MYKNKSSGKKRAAKGSLGRQTALLDLTLVSPVLFNLFVRFQIVFVSSPEFIWYYDCEYFSWLNLDKN